MIYTTSPIGIPCSIFIGSLSLSHTPRTLQGAPPPGGGSHAWRSLLQQSTFSIQYSTVHQLSNVSLKKLVISLHERLSVSAS